MDSVSPVLTEAEVESEQVIALDQEKYYPNMNSKTNLKFGWTECFLLAFGLFFVLAALNGLLFMWRN